jgi:hypothetical protein
MIDLKDRGCFSSVQKEALLYDAPGAVWFLSLVRVVLFIYSLLLRPFMGKKETRAHAKTYNSGDSLVATHVTTNLPVSCLNRAE